MSIQQEVLEAARLISRGRRPARFRLEEIVLALPHLKAGSVRTHVASRCCVNAPAHHPHRWGYFRRVSRGIYEILPEYARAKGRGRKGGGPGGGRGLRLSEALAGYGAPGRARPRDTIHAVVTRESEPSGHYVAECLEVPVVAHGRSLDEVVARLRQAIGLHLSEREPGGSGVTAAPRLSVTLETMSIPDPP